MINNIFQTQIYEVMMPGFDDIKQDVTDKLNTVFNDDSIHKNSEGTGKSIYWQVDGQLHNVIDIKPIIDFVTEEAKKFWIQLGYTGVDRVKVWHSWANVTPKDGWIINHHHRPCPLVGSFYINASPEMGNLYLEHPLNTLLAYQPYPINNRESYSNTHQVEVTSGKLVLFPGYLNHWTDKNPTDEDRIGLAFHFMHY